MKMVRRVKLACVDGMLKGTKRRREQEGWKEVKRKS